MSFCAPAQAAPGSGKPPPPPPMSLPAKRRAVRLHAYLYHGLYLDEIFTRLTFLLWPPGSVQPPERSGETPS